LGLQRRRDQSTKNSKRYLTMENLELTIALALVALTTGTVLLVNWAGNRNIPGLLKIALGSIVTSIGLLLLATQNVFPTLISFLLANALIVGGRIPVLLGLASFWNQEKSKLPLIFSISFVFGMVGFSYFSLIDVSSSWQIRIYTLMMEVYYFSTLFVLIRGLQIERKLRPAMAITSNYGASILITVFAFFAIMEFSLLLFYQPDAVSDAVQASSTELISAIVTLSILAFGIIIMTMEERAVEYQENAIYDPITTILNHRTFLEVSNRVLGIALRYTKPVSLLTIEVSNLDDVVQKFGIKVGNELLRHFSLMASDRRRNEDILARCGYNQFRMLLPGVDEAGAAVVLSKINQSLLSEEYFYRGKSLNVQIVVSAITKREEDLQLQQMFQEGEIELFRIKQGLESDEETV